MQGAQPERRNLDKKRTVVLLRSVVVVSTSYLILFGQSALTPASIGYILALVLSNVALTLTPKEWFREPRISAGLLLADTAAVLIGLYLTVGCFSQDFLIIYFFTIFLTTATESVGQIAVGAAMISGIYGYWLWISSPESLGAGEWLRLPFFFIVAVFYAYMTEEAKQERWRRQQAERETDHLRFLLDLGNGLAGSVVKQHLVSQLGSIVESAFPRLRCHAEIEPSTWDAEKAVFLPIRSRDRTFGWLRVTAGDATALSPEEEQFCKVVAMVAANALYAAEQMGVAQEGHRVKQEFLSVLSHELRSPLHVILGNADILIEELQAASGSLVHESIVRLRASAFRLLDIVEGLLCFAELRAGTSPVFVERVDIHDLVEELAPVITDQLAERPISFDWTIAPDLPVLQTDRRKVRLVVNGLLANAVKFTEKGFIHLGAERTANGQITITVQDSGIGIDQKDIAPIFQEFRQLDGSLKRRFDGLGLGLTLVHELVVSLGGRVDVESQPSCGSTFRVRLPAAMTPRASATARSTAPAVPAAHGWRLSNPLSAA